MLMRNDKIRFSRHFSSFHDGIRAFTTLESQACVGQLYFGEQRPRIKSGTTKQSEAGDKYSELTE